MDFYSTQYPLTFRLSLNIPEKLEFVLLMILQVSFLVKGFISCILFLSLCYLHPHFFHNALILLY